MVYTWTIFFVVVAVLVPVSRNIYYMVVGSVSIGAEVVGDVVVFK